MRAIETGGLVILMALAVSVRSSEATDGSAPPAPSASSFAQAGIDPCRLVTKEAAAQALGQEVDGPKNQPGGLPGQATCAYNSRTSVRLITISVIPSANAASLYKQFKDASQGGPDYQELSGLGDAAFRDAGQLYVLKNNMVLGIFVSGLGSSAGEVGAVQQTLAKAALSQL